MLADKYHQNQAGGKETIFHALQSLIEHIKEFEHIRIDAALRLFTIGGYIGILLMMVNNLIQKLISPGAFSAVFASATIATVSPGWIFRLIPRIASISVFG